MVNLHTIHKHTDVHYRYQLGARWEEADGLHMECVCTCTLMQSVYDHAHIHCVPLLSLSLYQFTSVSKVTLSLAQRPYMTPLTSVGHEAAMQLQYSRFRDHKALGVVFIPILKPIHKTHCQFVVKSGNPATISKPFPQQPFPCTQTRYCECGLSNRNSFQTLFSLFPTQFANIPVPFQPVPTILHHNMPYHSPLSCCDRYDRVQGQP